MFSKVSLFYLRIAFIALIGKVVLQMASAFPLVAQMGYEMRPITIAYLHLTLIGVISMGIVVCYLENGLSKVRLVKTALGIFLTSFFGMEICMVMTPWWNSLSIAPLVSASVATMSFSVFLSLSIALLVISFFLTSKKRLTSY